MVNLEFAALKEKYPELFVRTYYTENTEFLKRFGIVIPGKEKLPRGYLKYLPQDFIVEEIRPDGTICTIDFPTDYQSEVASLPETAPTYYATLVKCSFTTFQAVAALAEMLGIPEKSIQYAGIKDRRAITAQRISIRGTSREALAKVAHGQFFLKDLTAGKGVVAVGDLIGNRFSVMVRTDPSIWQTETAERLMHNLKYVDERGFYNFFYLQRFGTPRLMNYVWARHIIRGDYRAAIESFLFDPTDLEMPFFRNLRATMKSRGTDWGAMHNDIVSQLPQSLTHEQAVLAYLKDHPDDYQGALLAIEQQTRFWFIAYASRLFNQKISDLLLSNAPVPDMLPMPDSFAKSDLALYRTYFDRDGIAPPVWQHVRVFPQIRIEHREVATRSKVTIHSVNAYAEGIRWTFSLDKGQYATTFFSHLFDLVSGIDWDTNTTFVLNDIVTIDPETRAHFKEMLEPNREEEASEA
jgi:TruD family tRNA pseudouridine synthase